MKKSLSLFAVGILGILGLIIPLITLAAFKPLNQQNYTVNQQVSGINETDFINTMFLRSSFFENWSETNYFINPTLKTSKSLIYNDKWYLDFLKDSYSTGISFDKPSDEFMDLYKNWDIYTKQYNIDKFYDVDKKQFLKELTNFSYSFAKYFNTVEVINKLEKGVDNLQLVNLIHQNWKLVDINWQKDRHEFENEFKKLNNKWYFFIESDTYGFNKYLAINNGNNIKQVDNWNWILILNNGYAYFDASKIKSIYCWNGIGEPETPDINKNTGKITDWKE